MNRDARRLAAALDRAAASPIQRRMAAILLRVNGIDNALGYVRGVADGRGGPTMRPTMPGRSLVRFQHLTAYVRECWVLASDRRRSATRPDWTPEPTTHAIVIETVEVEPAFRRQGEFRAFLTHVCADERFDLVIVEGVQNPILAEALMRWGWEFDTSVMDFYRRRETP